MLKKGYSKKTVSKNIKKEMESGRDQKQDVGYFCGMSVPPFMMQRVADQIYKQWLSKE